MSITYDPITGEPIETPGVPEVTEAAGEAADAVTEAAAGAAETVNETVSEAADAAAETASDVAGAVEDAADQAAAVTEEAADTVQDAVNEVVETTDGSGGYSSPIPPEPAKSGFDPKWIIFGAIGLVAVAAIVFILTQLVFSKRVRVEKAIAKTMNIDSQLYKDCKNLAGILKGKSYTFTADIDADSVGSASGTVVVDGKDKQIAVDADITGVPSFSVLAGIDDKSVKFEAPDFSDYLFVYNYNEDNDGYLSDMAGEDTVDSLNSACKLLYNYSSGSDEYSQKVAKLTRDYEKKLKWKTADTKTYKVNDKKVKCKGYVTTIDKDLALDYWDDFTDLYLDEFGELNDELKKLSATDLKDSLKDIRDEIKSMKETDITFYIYKGALAAIEVDAGKNGSASIKFKGGDFRAQNMEFEADGEEIFEIEGEKSKDKETYTITAGRDEVEIIYNTKKGTIEIDTGSEDVEFDIKSTSKSFVISADEMDIEGEDVSFSLEINNSGKLQKYTNKDEFDLGTADKDDFEDLIDSFDMDKLGSLGYLF